MRVPEVNVPCIFVGPGTGIAPMRAMIEERVHGGAKGNVDFLHNLNVRQPTYIWQSKPI